MTNDTDAIHEWLYASYSIKVSSNWLAACVEWIQQECEGQVLSVAQLQTMVFEQWLLSDLKELGTACLPADLANQPSTQITGPLALQVEHMHDVGLPLYGQLQKAKGTLNANNEVSAEKPQQPAWEPKPSRMMLLKMTDGQTEVQGMEYKPISTLNASLQPGFKVLIHGQVNCCHGVLLLTENNLQVLGGEVDSLVEANTITAVLEHAMEMNVTNNGKHAKKEFSGRFIRKQDYKSGQNENKLLKDETNTTNQRPVSYKKPAATYWTENQNCCTKKEPLTMQSTADDEWEEDLDYGVLTTLDDPMEEELIKNPSTSYQSSLADHSRENVMAYLDHQFICSSSVSSSPGKSFVTNTSLKSSAVCPERTGNIVSVIKNELGSESVRTATGRENRSKKMWSQTLSVQKNSMAVPDNILWEDDDDFDLAQTDNDLLSPVIPVQDHFSTTQEIGKSASYNPVTCHSVVNEASLSNSSNAKYSVLPKLSSGAGASSSEFRRGPKVVTKFQNSSHIEIKSGPKYSLIPRESSTNSIARSCDFLTETKPPPSKQRKLTSMLASTKRETKPAIICPSSAVVDLTGDDVLSPGPAKDYMLLEVLPDTGNIQQKNIKASVANSKLVGNVSPQIRNGEVLDMEVVEGNTGNNPNQTDMVPRNNDILKAIMEPFINSENLGHVKSEPLYLKDVQNWLTSCSGGTNTFTVKGYIKTLTDRLRSGHGDGWSLSCLITDGTANLEVAIDDSMLTQLIGFSAKESMTLRQEARINSGVKDYLNKCLEKCQKTLIEFFGLIDLQIQADNSKPNIINMVQLEKIKR